MPQYSWFDQKMLLWIADRESFTEDCAWSQYEIHENAGRGLLPFFPGGFDPFHQAARGLGYPFCRRESEGESERCLRALTSSRARSWKIRGSSAIRLA